MQNFIKGQNINKKQYSLKNWIILAFLSHFTCDSSLTETAWQQWSIQIGLLYILGCLWRAVKIHLVPNTTRTVNWYGTLLWVSIWSWRSVSEAHLWVLPLLKIRGLGPENVEMVSCLWTAFLDKILEGPTCFMQQIKIILFLPTTSLKCYCL